MGLCLGHEGPEAGEQYCITEEWIILLALKALSTCD